MNVYIYSSTLITIAVSSRRGPGVIKALDYISLTDAFDIGLCLANIHWSVRLSSMEDYGLTGLCLPNIHWSVRLSSMEDISPAYVCRISTGMFDYLRWKNIWRLVEIHNPCGDVIR